jgi:hypothetical protein
MIISIGKIKASINHHWMLFPRHYEETHTVCFCQFCKNWAPMTCIIGALYFLLFSSLKILWVVL